MRPSKSLEKYRPERYISLSVFHTVDRTRAFGLLRVIAMARGCSARGLEPSEPKDIADPFAEANPQTLRAGRKIGTFEIVDPRLAGPPAKERQQPARKEAKK